jgi:hypothetical protein
MRYAVEAIEGLLTHALRRPCLLCGAKPDVAGAYVASGPAAERLGAAPERTRVVFYSLCDAHPRDDERTLEQVEGLIEAFVAFEAG